MQDAAAIQQAAEAVAVLGLLGMLSVGVLTFVWWLGVAVMTCYVADLKGFRADGGSRPACSSVP